MVENENNLDKWYKWYNQTDFGKFAFLYVIEFILGSKTKITMKMIVSV